MFFTFSMNVKADNSGTYKCYYPIEIKPDIKSSDKIYIEIITKIKSNKKDSVKIKFYDSKKDKTYDTYAGYKISDPTSNDLEKKDLDNRFNAKHYNNGCPTVFMADPINSSPANTVRVWTCDEKQCGTFTKVLYSENVNKKSKVPKDSTAANIKKCVYTHPRNRSLDYATLVYNFSTGEIYVEDKSATGTKKPTDMDINKMKETYSTGCPNKIYSTHGLEKYYLTPPGDAGDGVMVFKIKTQSEAVKLVPVEFSNKSMCDKLNDAGVLAYIKIFYTLLRFIAPTIIIVLSTIDFIGVVLSGDNDSMEKAKKKFIQRLIIGVVLLLLPALLEFLLKLAGYSGSLVDATCKLMD